MSILKTMAAGIAAVAMVGVFGGVAKAQGTTEPVQRPFTIKLGAFFPKSSDVKNTVGKTFFSAGVTYDFTKSTATSPTIISGFVDYTGSSKTRNGVKVELSDISVGPQVRFLLAPPTASATPYVGAGLGAYFVHVKGSASAGNVSVSDSTNKTKFGGKVFAGYELKQGFLLEGQYDFISKINGVDPGGATVRLGYRF